MQLTENLLSEQLENCSQASNYRFLTGKALKEDWRRIDEIIEIAKASPHLNGEKAALVRELREISYTLEALDGRERNDFITVACRRSNRITKLEAFRRHQQNKRGVSARAR